MRMEVEKAVGKAREHGLGWVENVVLLFEGELEEYEFEVDGQREERGFHGLLY